MQLTFNLEIQDAGWYPVAELTGFQTATGNDPDIKEKLVIVFTAPGKVTEGDIIISSSPYHEHTKKIESIDVGNGIFDIKITLKPSDGHPFGHDITKVHIGVNKSSETAPAWSSFSDSFAVAADAEPVMEGQLQIRCAAAPEGLELSPPELRLVRGNRTERLLPKFNQSSRFQLTAGVYQIVVSELKTEDGTLRAPAIPDGKEVIIKKGQTSQLNIAFGKPERSTTIDIVLAVAGATELYKEEITFSCLSNGQEMLTIILHDGEKHRLEQLPTEGDFIIRVHDIRLNNIHYAFDECKVRLDGRYHEVAFNKERMRQRDDTDTDASKLILEVQTEKTLNRTFTLRLTDRGTPPRQYRFDNILVQNGKNVQLTLVAPGSYQAMLTPLINDSIVYYIDTTPAPLTVSGKQPATLNVGLTEGACLQVKGFPGFLGFGGCANMSPGNADDFVEARVSSLFKYAGDDGMGDAGGFLPPEKEPTPKVIQLARDVSARLKDPVPVLPVMISYTCNLSLGDVEKIIRDPLRHKFSFANFIQALQMAQDKKTPEHPVPAGFIVNPDFLGECQKSGFSPTYPLPVRQPLKEALTHHKVSSDLPADITDTLKGYVKAVNWLARIIAPDVVIGWQVNLWGISGAQWIYKDFDYAGVYAPEDNQHKKMRITPQRAGEITAKYALSVGVFDDISSGDLDTATGLLKGADFMAVDRYEADDFTVRSYGNGYCYSPYEWGRFFDFCASLSRHLRKPVMPWQIPASHLATTADQVGTNAGKPGEGIDEQHWGSGGSYLMGHPEIGTSVNAINTQLLDIKFIPAFVDTLGRNVRELFSRHPWNLSQPGYLDFPARGIFHVQLGGGATTGVVSAVGDPGNWVRTRLHTYRNHPVMFTARTEANALQWTPSPGDREGRK